MSSKSKPLFNHKQNLRESLYSDPRQKQSPVGHDLGDSSWNGERILCCGSSGFGQLGASYTMDSTKIDVCATPCWTSIEAAIDWQSENDYSEREVNERVGESIAAGKSVTLSTTSNGRKLFFWGKGSLGKRIHDHNRIPRQLPRFCPNKKIVKISCGWEDHVAVVTEDGICWTWGSGEYGKLGHGNTNNEEFPRQVRFGDKSVHIISASCGTNHTILLTQKGRIWSFGDGSRGQLALECRNCEKGYQLQPECSTALQDILSAVCTNNATVLLVRQSEKKNSIYACGEAGFLKSSKFADTKDQYLQNFQLKEINGPWNSSKKKRTSIRSIDAGYEHISIVTVSGKLYTMGENEKGQLGNGTNESSSIPILVRLPKIIGREKEQNGMKIEKSVCGFYCTFAITTEGKVFSWGGNEAGQLGLGDSYLQDNVKCPVKINALSQYVVTNISSGRNHSIFLISNDVQNFKTLQPKLDFQTEPKLSSDKLDNSGHREVSQKLIRSYSAPQIQRECKSSLQEKNTEESPENQLKIGVSPNKLLPCLQRKFSQERLEKRLVHQKMQERMHIENIRRVRERRDERIRQKILRNQSAVKIQSNWRIHKAVKLVSFLKIKEKLRLHLETQIEKDHIAQPVKSDENPIEKKRDNHNKEIDSMEKCNLDLKSNSFFITTQTRDDFENRIQPSAQVDSNGKRALKANPIKNRVEKDTTIKMNKIIKMKKSSSKLRIIKITNDARGRLKYKTEAKRREKEKKRMQTEREQMEAKKKLEEKKKAKTLRARAKRRMKEMEKIKMKKFEIAKHQEQQRQEQRHELELKKSRNRDKLLKKWKKKRRESELQKLKLVTKKAPKCNQYEDHLSEISSVNISIQEKNQNLKKAMQNERQKILEKEMKYKNMLIDLELQNASKSLKEVKNVLRIARAL